MGNNKLIEIYNENLGGGFLNLKISSFSDFDKFSTDDLKVLFDLFSDKIAEAGIDSKGNITEKGAALDEVAGKINNVILSRK